MSSTGMSHDSSTELVLDSVSKSYESTSVLRGVSLRAEGGDFIAIVGPSGVGKTTLLGIIGGLERPSSGKVLFNGRDLATLDDRQLAKYRNKSVGFIHQTFNLIPFFSARENVAVPMVIAGKQPSWAGERSLSLLESVGLKEKANLIPKQLSGGEQQRVTIARALCNEASVILADEPTANLDERNEGVIIGHLLKLVDEGKVVILATHDGGLARCASRILAIEEDGLHEI